MNKMVAFSWYGGKTSHLKWLLPIINQIEHVTYNEPFGGSAAVLLNKQPSKIEVYNDVYGDVVNFFRVLRDKREELLPLLELTPYSRLEFEESLRSDRDTDVERARKFFVVARQVRTGLATTASVGRWAYVTRDSRRGMALVVSRWLSAIDGLEDICNRLREVQIENLPGFDVITRYDTTDTLHYIDPPYLMSERSGGVGYQNEMSEEKHVELLNIVKSLSGKVVISGYQNNLYDDILTGWKKSYEDAKFAAATRQNGKPALRQEVIWSNCDFQ
jgi:DNA adenine methylase